MSKLSWIHAIFTGTKHPLTLVALTVAAFLLGSTNTRADEVVWIAHTKVLQDSYIYFNMLTGDVSGSYSPTATFSIGNSSGSPAFNQTVIAGQLPSNKVIHSGPDAVNLSVGDEVDATGPYWQTANLASWVSGTIYSNFPAEETGYVGLTFTIDAHTFYGWASIVREADTALITLTGFGYNDTPGAASMIAPIPEPAAWSLLTVGALAGFAGIIRRRREN